MKLIEFFTTVILLFLGNDGYVAFQVEGNPAPTVEWFKVYSCKRSKYV